MEKTITIHWEGGLSVDDVLLKRKEGISSGWTGDEDFGLYQIYGQHILDEQDAPGYKPSLLYIGEATEQTFADRFGQHRKDWLEQEWGPVTIYLGRNRRMGGSYSDDEWKADILLAEKVLIYTYSPHYNANSIADAPDLGGFTITLVNEGSRGRLWPINVVPRDYK